MLHYKTIESQTLELLKELMKLYSFRNFRLVGETSLALQIGHRQSVDLDLFGQLDIDEYELDKILNKLGEVIQLKKSQNINIFLINGIKVDLVNYHYPWLEDIIENDNIRLAGLKDIAAMKLAAVTGRGSKKDFIDIYFLLKYFSLSEMFSLYNLKYKDGSDFFVLKSLLYFDDADVEETPKMLERINWEKIKISIVKLVEEYVSK